MGTMDARALRSRSRLHAAILALAAIRPIHAISVSEVCRDAAITRDTFYRHARSPVELLADALGTELAAATVDAPQHDSVLAAERALLTHVASRADVYRGALHPGLAAPVRYRLEQLISTGLRLRLEQHPDLIPDSLRGDSSAVDMAVAYAAAGTVGAIEVWLRTDDRGIDRAASTILAASPEWWLRERAARERSTP